MFRKIRYFYWVARELVGKYTRALTLGLMVGLIVAIGLWRIIPIVQLQWFMPIKRIGIIGQYTPSALPLSIQKLISSGLTDISENGKPIPSMAMSWESTDSGRVYVFHLRNDVFWHNGKPFLSSDVNYNIRNVTFTFLDAHTLKAVLQNPYSPFPVLLSKPIFASGLLGVGPYRAARIQLKGDRVQYLKLLPVGDSRLPSREYRFYQTEAQANIAFKLGEIDELDDVTALDTMASWGLVSVNTYTRYGRIVTLFFRLSDPLLKEKSIRQAFAYGLPSFSSERAYSPLSKTSWAYTDKVRHYETDLSQAKSLISQTIGATSSASLTITTFPQYVDIAQKVANNWTSLGIQTTVKVENSLPPDFQVLLSAQDIPPDPDQYPFWHSTQSTTNITGYANVKIDKLLEDGRQETDEETRKKIYADFQRRLVDDAPVLFLYYPTYYTISRTGTTR